MASFDPVNPTHKCHKEEMDVRRAKGQVVEPRRITSPTPNKVHQISGEHLLTEQDIETFLPSKEVFEQKGTLHTGVKNVEAERQPHYKMTQNIPLELSDWTLLTTKKVYLQYLESEEEEFWQLFGKAGVTKPEGMRPIKLGSRGGKTKPGPVCAHLLMEIPSDKSILETLNRTSDEGKHAFKVVEVGGEKLLKVYDLRFILKMIHDYGLPITHYPGRPRNSPK
jgi:hypothetical protein